jgi:hypothetical protein
MCGGIVCCSMYKACMHASIACAVPEKTCCTCLECNVLVSFATDYDPARRSCRKSSHHDSRPYIRTRLYYLPPASKKNTHIYSPNNLRTLFNTLSFSGSYGWSLDGISNNDGNAAVYASTRCLIFSAMCWLISRMAMSLRSWVNLSNAASMAAVSVLASTTRKFFWLSGGCVTCWNGCQVWDVGERGGREVVRLRLRGACRSLCPAVD